MILIDVKNYLVEKKSATLVQIANYFQQRPEVVRDMLLHWQRKGKVQLATKPSGCGSRCLQCGPTIAEVYKIVEN